MDNPTTTPQAPLLSDDQFQELLSYLALQEDEANFLEEWRREREEGL
jgi:hypothetical protein